jgi:hypothetical protein
MIKGLVAGSVNIALAFRRALPAGTLLFASETKPVHIGAKFIKALEWNG